VGGTCSLAALGFGLFLAPCSFPFCRVITQIRGIDGKSLQIYAKLDYNIS
jgi:hypothetical protein